MRMGLYATQIEPTNLPEEIISLCKVSEPAVTLAHNLQGQQHPWLRFVLDILTRGG
jgi:hypothetical protein